MNRADVIEQTWAAHQPHDGELPAELGVPIGTRIMFSRAHPDLPIPKRVKFEERHGEIVGIFDSVEVVVEPVEVVVEVPEPEPEPVVEVPAAVAEVEPEPEPVVAIVTAQPETLEKRKP